MLPTGVHSLSVPVMKLKPKKASVNKSEVSAMIRPVIRACNSHWLSTLNLPAGRALQGTPDNPSGTPHLQDLTKGCPAYMLQVLALDNVKLFVNLQISAWPMCQLKQLMYTLDQTFL